MGDAQELYPVVDYAFSTVPTYPDGQIGYIMAQKGVPGEAMAKDVLRTAKRKVPDAMKAKLRWYSEEIHAAAFVLPAFSQKKLGEIRAPQTVAAAQQVNYSQFAAVAAVAAAIGAGIALLVTRK